MTQHVTLADVRAAAGRICGGESGVYRSPLHRSELLSRLCGCEIFAKQDFQQITGSFKERGALNKLLQLKDGQRKAGVICASAGNHAQAVAYHGVRLGIPVTVVMPKWAPLIKVQNCRAFGAEVRLEGSAFDESYGIAMQEAERTGKVFVPGFDDAAIVAGAGTMGLEVVEDLEELEAGDAVIVPVGGGGLAAGVGVVMKALRPGVRVIGAEPVHCPSLTAALAAGRPVKVDGKPTLADGLGVATVGRIPFEVIREGGFLERVELVEEGEIARAVLMLMEREKAVVEGAGAMSRAEAMRAKALGLEGRRVVILLCGGNIDVTVISKVIDRGLAADGRICRVTCRMMDRPGSLARVAKILGAAGANVMDVFHERRFGEADVAKVAITAIVETRDRGHIGEVVGALEREGIDVVEEG